MAKARVHFSPEIFTRICGLIADGKSLREVCAMKDMPDRMTFNEWRKRTPELQAEYDQACKDQEDATFDDIQYIADTVNDAAKARNMIDARKWRLRIRNRKVYGDKLGLDGGEDGSPIKIVKLNMAPVEELPE